MLLWSLLLQSADAATWTVCAASCDYTSISGAHASSTVVDGDTLTIAAGTYSETVALTITKDLTLSGAGSATTILTRPTTSTLTSDLIDIDGAIVTISGLTIEPAGTYQTSIRAVDIYNAADVTMSDIVIATHSSSVYGAGIQVTGATLALSDSALSDLVTTGSATHGGAICGWNSAVITVTDVTFDRCKSSTGSGGAILVWNLVTLDIVGGSVSNSTANGGGTAGAVYVGYLSTSTIDGTTFTDNVADYGGALVEAYTSDLTVSNATFTNNDADVVGGAFYVAEGGTFALVDSTVSGGTAVAGGGLYVNNGTPTVTITGGSFTGNRATDDGGAIFSYGLLTVTDVDFDDNDAVDRGGAIDVYYSDATVTGGTISGSDAEEGGGIWVDNGALELTGTTFDDNDATTDGGHVRATVSTAKFFDATFSGGNAARGGAFWGGSVSTTSFTNCAFETGTSTGAGGHVATGSSLTISGSTFESGVAGTSGGAIYVENGAAAISDSVFDGNTAANGGAIYLTASSTATLLRNALCSNTASASGGGIYATSLSTGATHVVANNLLVGNRATSTRGGGLFATAATTLDVLNNTLLANTAPTATTSVGGGGAHFTGDADFRNNLVSGTTAGDGLNGASTTAGIATYGAWYANSAADASGTVTLGGTNVRGSDPLLYGDAADLCSIQAGYQPVSPLVDKGDAAVTDLDGSRSDIGMFGGPYAAADAWKDGDSDTWELVYDCDDADPDVSPGATETCDGLDQDCDGVADDIDDDAPDGLWWYRDADEDGFGDASDAVFACEAPTGYVADDTDCDDTDPALSALETFYADVDGDGFGDPDAPVIACEQPADATIDDTDCDDDDPSVLGGTHWYSDADGDGHGDASIDVIACEQPEGYVATDTDCDDFAAGVNPDADETCNGIDDNCDGGVDADPVDPTAWHEDADGDGYGDPDVKILGCDAPEGYVDNADDCANDDADTYPGALERCDGIDNDCDGTADDGVVEQTWYSDADEDGFGADASATVTCDPAPGAVLEGGDCDDADATAFPGATEIPDDGIDQDCDGEDGTAEVPGDSSRQWLPGDPVLPGPAGCGCATGSAPPASALLLALAALARRFPRRRAVVG